MSGYRFDPLHFESQNEYFGTNSSGSGFARISNCSAVCPTVTANPTSPSLWVLTCFYGIIAILNALVMFRGSSKMVSFRNVFLGMQCLLCLHRVIMFTVEFEWNMFTLLLVMYCYPIFLQFVTFSLLIVFLIKCLLVMKELNYMVARYLYPAFALISVAIGVACVCVSYAAYKQYYSTSGRKHGGFDHGVSEFAIVVFGVLSLCISITGYKTHRLLMKFVLSEARRKQVSGVTYVVIVYCVIFFARSIWGTLYLFNCNPLQALMNRLEVTDLEMYYFACLMFYSIFEILPTIFLLYSFYNWARPNVGGYAKIPDSGQKPNNGSVNNYGSTPQDNTNYFR
eukprot:m.160170 g.160170  ORF g.160170 m.160170 type:complete len:339 (+) comp31172_c1_seq1:391-1407(+)